MKKIISMILVFTMIFTTVNVSFAAEVEQGDITSYGASAVNDIAKLDSVLEKVSGFTIVECETGDEEQTCVQDSEQFILNNVATAENVEAISEEQTSAISTTYSSTDFTFNANLLTSFNTITGPIAGNGANEPKFSYNSFMEESISDYSGELTLNFEDLVLDGRNGLDLRLAEHIKLLHQM